MASPDVLGLAWRLVESALPEGWVLWGVRYRTREGTSGQKQWEAWAGTPHNVNGRRLRASGYSPDEPEYALIALYNKLTSNSDSPAYLAERVDRLPLDGLLSQTLAGVLDG